MYTQQNATYPDKTIMEVHPEQRGRDGPIALKMLLHDRTHNGLRSRARPTVEAYSKAIRSQRTRDE